MPKTTLWKENWEESRRHFVEWWEHRGLVLTIGGGGSIPASPVSKTSAAGSV